MLTPHLHDGTGGNVWHLISHQRLRVEGQLPGSLQIQTHAGVCAATSVAGSASDRYGPVDECGCAR